MFQRGRVGELQACEEHEQEQRAQPEGSRAGKRGRRQYGCGDECLSRLELAARHGSEAFRRVAPVRVGVPDVVDQVGRARRGAVDGERDGRATTDSRRRSSAAKTSPANRSRFFNHCRGRSAATSAAAAGRAGAAARAAVGSEAIAARS